MAAGIVDRDRAAIADRDGVDGSAPPLLGEVCGDKSASENELRRVLVGRPGEWERMDRRGLYPLHVLCLNSMVAPETLGIFLDSSPEAAGLPDKAGLYPLHRLCQNPAVTPELLSAYLGRFPDAGSQADGAGYYPLHALCGNVAVTPELLDPLLAAWPEAAARGNEACSYPLHMLCMNPAVTQQLLEHFLRFCPKAAEQGDDLDLYPLHCLCSNPAITKPPLKLLLQRCPRAAQVEDLPVLRLCKNPACTSGLLDVLQTYYFEHHVEDDKAFLEELKVQLSQHGSAAMHILNFICCERKIEIEFPNAHRTTLRVDGYTLPDAPRTAMRDSDRRDGATVDGHFAEALLPSSKPLEDRICLRHSGRTPAKVTVCRLRGLCCYDVVRALAKSHGRSALSTDSAQAVLEHVWSKFFWWYVVLVIVDVLALALVVDVTIRMRQKYEVHDWELGLIAAHILMYILVQVICFLDSIVVGIRSTRYSSAVGAALGVVEYLQMNCGGALTLVLEVVALTVMTGRDHLGHLTLVERWFLAGWCGLRWLQFVWGMRTLEQFGPRMLPIVYSLRDTLAFAIIFAVFVTASAHAYYVIGTRKDPVGHEFHGAFVIAYRLGVMGDFDLYEIEDNDPYWEATSLGLEEVDKPASEYYYMTHIWFYITSILVSLMMTNILTGILGSNYDRFTEVSRPLFLRERARAILRMSACLRGPLSSWVWPEEWAKQDLWMSQRAARGGEEISAREAFRAAIETCARKPLEAKIDHFEGRIDEKVQHLDQRVGGMEAKLDKLLRPASEEGQDGLVSI
mmetsp:Transcript_67737/g.201491  ORF Transcript_67737/g.201491 Transcript_67737/m.201491 type:complete len:794 (+) Transcript_67737:31-2412(+)